MDEVRKEAKSLRPLQTSDLSLHPLPATFRHMNSGSGRSNTNLSAKTSPISNHLEAYEKKNWGYWNPWRKEMPDKQLEHWFKERGVVSMPVVDCFNTSQ
jgi:hypothetical protein